MATSRRVGELITPLAAFIAVCESGGFTQAASALGKSISSISRRVSRLERGLGVDLIIRSYRPDTIQKMTPQGKRLFEATRHQLGKINRAMAAAQKAR